MWSLNRKIYYYCCCYILYNNIYNTLYYIIVVCRYNVHRQYVIKYRVSYKMKISRFSSTAVCSEWRQGENVISDTTVYFGLFETNKLVIQHNITYMLSCRPEKRTWYFFDPNKNSSRKSQLLMERNIIYLDT